MDAQRRQLMWAAALAAMGAGARAQDWPARPMRLVAGGAGSVTDIRARWLAERLSVALGQPMIVENVAAAGGNLAAEQVARSAPDGHTLLLTHQGIAVFNAHLYARLAYDPLADFVPVTRFGHGSLLLTVHPGVPAASLRELLALAKARPGSLNFGSPGNGTPPHLASEWFKRVAGIEATHVPFRGGGALMTALLGGHITWSMDGLTAQLPHVRSGGVRALAVTGAQRSPALPEVPTIAEAGVPGFEFSSWTGIAVPAATPRPVVTRLHAEIVRISATDEARQWFAAGGAEAGSLTPEQFADLIRAEHARFGKLIRDAGLRAE